MIAALALSYVLVQPGDTLSGIAASHGVSLAAVEAANDFPNPDLIYAGQVVKLRGGATAVHHHHFTYHSAVTGKTYGVSYGYPNYCGDGDGDGWDAACGQHVSPAGTQSAPVQQSTTGGYHHATRHPYNSSPSVSGPPSGSGGVSSVPGVPQGFAACVAYHESTNGTNQAYNGGVYGIIRASGVNVNGQSVSAQKQAFADLYRQYGTKPWAGDGCTG